MFFVEWTVLAEDVAGLCEHGNEQTLYCPTMHTTLKNAGLLQYFKIKEDAPTCFGLQ